MLSVSRVLSSASSAAAAAAAAACSGDRCPSTIRQRGDAALGHQCPRIPADVLAYPNDKFIVQLPLQFPPPPPDSNEASHVNHERRVSLNEMLDDMHAALAKFRSDTGFGRGIAAPQLGYQARAIALQFPDEGTSQNRFDMINPSFTPTTHRKWTLWDDCFSFPDVLVRVERHFTGDIAYQNRKGDDVEWMGLAVDRAELIQHEIDHLDGKLAFDRAAPMVVPKDDKRFDALWKEDGLVDAATGTICIVPRPLYEKHKQLLMRLVSPIYEQTHRR